MGVERGRGDERGGRELVRNPPCCSVSPKPMLVDKTTALLMPASRTCSRAGAWQLQYHNQRPAKLEGTLAPPHLPCLNTRLQQQPCRCWGNIAPALRKLQFLAGWRGRARGERGKQQRGYQRMFLLTAPAARPRSRSGTDGGFRGTSAPRRESLRSQCWKPPAPKLSAAGPVAHKKLYKSFGGE